LLQFIVHLDCEENVYGEIRDFVNLVNSGPVPVMVFKMFFIWDPKWDPKWDQNSCLFDSKLKHL
jgi:hypothetical protein